MKKLILILLVSFPVFSQTETPVNVTTFFSGAQLSKVTMHSFDKIEIDGHIIDRKTIKFEVTLEGLKISDSIREYQYRKCDKEGCRIVHLERKQYVTTRSWGNPQNLLLTN